MANRTPAAPVLLGRDHQIARILHEKTVRFTHRQELLVMGVTVVLAAGNDDVLVVLKTCMKKPH